MTDTLFWKDVRLLRPVIWSAIVLGVVFYVVGPVLGYVDWRRDWTKRYSDQPTHVTSPSRMPVTPSAGVCAEQAGILIASGASMMFAVNLLLVTTVAGMAFAVERRERWAEFGAMLPVSRRRALAAKGLASVAVSLGMLVVNAIVFVIGVSAAGLNRYAGAPATNSWPYNEIAIYFAILIGMAGMAWLLSSILRSAVLSTGVAVGAVVFVWFYISLMESDLHYRSRQGLMTRQTILATCVLAAGLLSWLAGTVVQLKRRSP